MLSRGHVCTELVGAGRVEPGRLICSTARLAGKLANWLVPYIHRVLDYGWAIGCICLRVWADRWMELPRTPTRGKIHSSGIVSATPCVGWSPRWPHRCTSTEDKCNSDEPPDQELWNDMLTFGGQPVLRRVARGGCLATYTRPHRRRRRLIIRSSTLARGIE